MRWELGCFCKGKLYLRVLKGEQGNEYREYCRLYNFGMYIGSIMRIHYHFPVSSSKENGG